MKFTTGLLILITLLVASCGGDNSGSVAVIDLDEIASVTGRDKVIAERVKAFTTEQQGLLTKLRDELRNNIEQEQKKLGKKPAKEKLAKFDQLTQSSEIKLRQEISRVKDVAAQLRVNLVMEFKKEVEPVASSIAKQRGMSIVMIKQNAMLYIDPTADITNDVIDELKKKGLVDNKQKTDASKVSEKK